MVQDGGVDLHLPHPTFLSRKGDRKKAGNILPLRRLLSRSFFLV